MRRYPTWLPGPKSMIVTEGFLPRPDARLRRPFAEDRSPICRRVSYVDTARRHDVSHRLDDPEFLPSREAHAFTLIKPRAGYEYMAGEPVRNSPPTSGLKRETICEPPKPRREGRTSDRQAAKDKPIVAVCLPRP